MSWLVFHYRPTALFSLKTSRATSTVGKSLLVPTPYAVKMAFLDVGLRTDRIDDPDGFVRALASTAIRIGVPSDACVTGTIQKIRQEPKPPSAKDREKASAPKPPYISNIALREVVHLNGPLSIALEEGTCPPVLTEIAPAINYFGKRGSFVQFEGEERRADLDASFTHPLHELVHVPSRSHLATLDDFGPEANFDAMNSFSQTPIKRDTQRTWIESAVPLGVFNVGPGFVHYKR